MSAFPPSLRLLLVRSVHAYLWCTYTEILMHEISDLMQGFTFSQVINYMVYISIQYFLPYCDSLCQKLSQYGETILP